MYMSSSNLLDANLRCQYQHLQQQSERMCRNQLRWDYSMVSTVYLLCQKHTQVKGNRDAWEKLSWIFVYIDQQVEAEHMKSNKHCGVVCDSLSLSRTYLFCHINKNIYQCFGIQQQVFRMKRETDPTLNMFNFVKNKLHGIIKFMQKNNQILVATKIKT